MLDKPPQSPPPALPAATLLGVMGTLCLIMSLGLHPPLLLKLWAHTPPVPAWIIKVLWALHLGGTLCSAVLISFRRRLAAWRTLHAAPGLLAAAAGLTCACFLVFLFEAVFGTLNLLRAARPAPIRSELAMEVITPDPELHHRLTPGFSGPERIYRTSDNAIIYDVTYTIGADGWRVVPGGDGPGRAQHLLFFGCSFTFGTGLEDNETIPAQAALHAPGYHVYNLGVGGYGTAHVLRMLETRDLTATVDEPEGVAVYLFMEDHLRRALGTMRRFIGFGNRYPYYSFDETGRPMFQGTFDDARKPLNRAYTWLAREQFIQWSGMDIPPSFSTPHFEAIARLTAEAKAHYLRQFPGGRFCVAIFPGTEAAIDQPALISAFREKDIEVLTFPEAGAFCQGTPCIFEFDGHPMPALAAFLGERIAEAIAAPAAP